MTPQDPSKAAGGYEESGPTIPAGASAEAAKIAQGPLRDLRPDVWTPRKFTQTALNIFSREEATDEERQEALTDGLSALTTFQYGSPNAEVRNWATGLKRSMVREQLRSTGALDQLRAAFDETDKAIRDRERMADRTLIVYPVTLPDGKVERRGRQRTTEELYGADYNDLLVKRSQLLSQLQYVDGAEVQKIERDPSMIDKFLAGATGGMLGDAGGRRTSAGTYDRDHVWTVPDSIADRDLAFGTEGLDRLSRSSILVGPRKDTGDDRIVIDAGGAEIDLTEQVRKFSTPEVKNSLRRVMAGIDDRAVFPRLSQQGSLSMGAVETIGNYILPEQFSNGYWWNTNTAHPDVKLRYLPKLYEGDDDGFRSWQALQDPTKFRAVMEVMGQMQKDGELGKQFWEQVGGMAVGMAEFIALAATVEGGVAKVAAKIGTTANAARIGSLAETLPAIPWGAKTGQKLAQLAGYGSKKPYWRGLQFGGRDIVEEVMYGTAQGILYPEMSVKEGALQGFGEGVAEAGIGAASGLFRRGMAGLILPQLSEGHIANRMADARKFAGDHNYQLNRVLELPSGRIDLTKKVESVFTDARRADALMKTFDALAVGAVFGGYEDAVLNAGPEWERMGVGEKAVAIAKGMGSDSALGNMALFGGTAAGHYTANAQGWGALSAEMNADQRKAVDGLARGIVQDLSAPDNLNVMAQYAEMFDQLVQENPELAKGLVFRAPAEQTSVGERVIYDRQLEEQGFGEMKAGAVRDAQKFVGEFQRSRVTEQKKDELVYEATGPADSAATIWLHNDVDEDLAVKRVEAKGHFGYAVVHASHPDTQVEETKLWSNPWQAMTEAREVIGRRADARGEARDEAKGQERIQYPEGARAAEEEQAAKERLSAEQRKWRVERKMRWWREWARKPKPGPEALNVEPPRDAQGRISFPSEKAWRGQAAEVGRQIIEQSMTGKPTDLFLAKSILSLLRQMPESRYGDSIANALETVIARGVEIPVEAVQPAEAEVLERASELDPRQAAKPPGKAVPDQVARENKDRRKGRKKGEVQTRITPPPKEAPAGDDAYGIAEQLYSPEGDFDEMVAKATEAAGGDEKLLERIGYWMSHFSQQAQDVGGMVEGSLAAMGFEDAIKKKIVEGLKPKKKALPPKKKALPQTRRKPAPVEPPPPEVESDPARVERYQGRATGRDDTLFVAGGKELPIKFRVVDADDVLPSHDARQRFKRNPGSDKNERPYDDPTEGIPYRATVEDVATNPKPRLIFNNSPTTVDGVPVVNGEGVVLGGNARTMGMQLAYFRGGESAKIMRSEATAFAESVGIDPAALEGIANPIVVREIQGEAAGVRGELSRDLNESLTTARTAATDAASRGARVTQQVARDIGAILNLGTLADSFNSKSKTTELVGVLVKAGVLSDADVTEIKLDTGLLSKSGRDRIEQALLGAAIGDARRIVEMSPQHRNKILRSLPAITRLKGAWPAFMGHLENMLDGAKSLRESKLGIDDSIKHETLLAEAWKTDEVAIALLRRFTADKELAWAKRMGAVEENLRDAQIGQPDIFGESGPTDPWAILSNALELEGYVSQIDPAHEEVDAPDLFTQGEDLPSLEHAVARLGNNDEIAIDLMADLETGWAPIVRGTRKALGDLRKSLITKGIPFDYLATDEKRTKPGTDARLQLVEAKVDPAKIADKGRGTMLADINAGTARYIGRNLGTDGGGEGLTYQPQMDAESIPGGMLLGGITLEDARRLLDPQAVQMDDQVRVGNRARARVDYMLTPPGETPGERLARALKLEAAYTPPDPSGFRVPGEDFARPWHGTPHDFDSFSMEAIGSGEGTQAFGHGLYFAERKGVGGTYSRMRGTKGNLLRVELAPKQSEYLLWDVPFEEQSALVKGILKENGWGKERSVSTGWFWQDPDARDGPFSEVGPFKTKQEAEADASKHTTEEYTDGFAEYVYQYEDYSSGRLIYRNVSRDPKKASQKLLAAGIRGIKYLDGPSRPDGEGTYNYVIFDEADIKIVGRRGQGETPTVGPPKPGPRYQIDELAAQPIETALARLAQAGATGQRAAKALFEAGVSQDASPHSQEAQDAMRDLLAEDAGQRKSSIFRQFEDAYGDKGLETVTARYEEALTSARAYLSFTQLAALELARGDARTEGVLRTYFRAKEDLARNGEISPAVRAELKRANMLGEDGVGISLSADGELAQWMVDARQHALNEGGETMYAADPFMAFGGPRLMDEYGVRLFPEKGRRGERFASLVAKSPRWAQAINRKLTKMVGRPTLAAGLPSVVKRQNYQGINGVIRTAKAKEAQELVLSQELSAQMTMPSGAPLPAKIDKRLTKLIQMNGMKRITNPRQLGQALGDQSYAYLFGPVKRMMEQADSIGADLSAIGFLTDEQVQNRRGSYLMRERIRKDDRDMRERMADKGRMDLFAGRDLPVDAHAENLMALDVFSSSYLHTKGMAQESRIRMLLGVLDGFVDRGVAMPHAEFVRKTARGKPLYDKATRQWYEMAASKHAPVDQVWNPSKGKIGAALDPINGRGIAARQTLLHDTLLQLRERMADPPQEGEGPSAGHPYIELMRQRVDDWIGTDEKPGYVINSFMAAELEMMVRDMLETAPPVGGPLEAVNKGVLGEYVAKRMDDLTRYWRRTVTIGSPVHWTLARTSDVLTNWAMDSVGIVDFASSIIFGKGVYADSMRHLLWWQRWQELGKPEGEKGPNGERLLPAELKAQGWTEDQWAAVLDVDWHSGYIIGGTFTTTLIESNALGSLIGSAVREDDLTAKLREEMRQRGMGPGKPGRELTATFTDAITEYGRRMADGQAAFDRKIQEAFDQGDTEHRLKAISDWTAQYQMYELLSKYAASMGLRKKNPMLSREAAAIYGAQGTADYANTSPWLRRWTTSMNWMRGQQWDKLEKAPGFKRFARMMTQTPFLLYQSNMTPALMRVAVRRPHKVALAMGLQAMLKGALSGVGLGALAAKAALSDGDDERRMQALAGSYQQPGRPYITHEEAQQLVDMLPSAPGVGDWIKGDPKLNRIAKEMFLGILAADSGSIRAPRRTRGETRVTDLARLNPLLENAQALAQGARDLPTKGGWGLARSFIDFAEGIIPTMGGAALTGTLEVAVPSDGKRRMEALAEVATNLAGNMTSAFDPTLAPFSRQGQLGVQMSLLEGQSIKDYVAGYTNDYPLPPEDRLAALVFGSMWSNQKVMRKSRYRPEAEISRQVLDQLGIRVDTQDPLGREWEYASRKVTRQWLDTAQATYARWSDYGVTGGVEEQADNLDKMFAENLLVFRDLDKAALEKGIYQLREGDLKSSLAQMIAKEPPAVQARMLRIATGLAEGPGWEGGGKAALLEMARMKLVEPEVFGGLYEATLKDAHGRGILDYFHKLIVKEGRRDNLAELHQLWLKVPVPAQNDRRELYDSIDEVLFPGGKGWPQEGESKPPSGEWGLGEDPDLMRTGVGARDFIRRNRPLPPR